MSGPSVFDTPETLAKAHFAAWNAHDMEAMAATLAADADWVNVVGMYWRGREQILFALSAFHAGMFRDVQLDVKAMHKRQVSLDLAILMAEFVQDAYAVPNGPQQPEALDRATLVAARGPEGWRIIHGHNTIVDPRAAPNDPVLRMMAADVSAAIDLASIER